MRIRRLLSPDSTTVIELVHLVVRELPLALLHQRVHPLNIPMAVVCKEMHQVALDTLHQLLLIEFTSLFIHWMLWPCTDWGLVDHLLHIYKSGRLYPRLECLVRVKGLAHLFRVVKEVCAPSTVDPVAGGDGVVVAVKVYLVLNLFDPSAWVEPSTTPVSILPINAVWPISKKDYLLVGLLI